MMDIIEEKLRKNFRVCLEASGFSHRDFAHFMQVNTSTVTRWLSGSAVMRADHLYKASKVLKVPIAKLFGEDEGTGELLSKMNSLQNELASYLQSPKNYYDQIISSLDPDQKEAIDRMLASFQSRKNSSNTDGKRSPN